MAYDFARFEPTAALESAPTSLTMMWSKRLQVDATDLTRQSSLIATSR